MTGNALNTRERGPPPVHASIYFQRALSDITGGTGPFVKVEGEGKGWIPALGR